MIGVKPNQEMWRRVSAVIFGESAADVIVTFQSAMCQMMIQSGVCEDEEQARVHLAAILLSPDTSARPGSLVPLLHAELARVDNGRSVQ